MNTGAYGRTATLLTTLVVAGFCSAVAAEPALSEKGGVAPSGEPRAGSSAPVSPQAAENPDAASGLMIYIDPKTGAILEGPAPGTVPLLLTPDLQNALSTSDTGLVEVPSPVPGGGVKLDLQGRFQSPLFATIDADGKIKIRHLHKPSAPATGRSDSPGSAVNPK